MIAAETGPLLRKNNNTGFSSSLLPVFGLILVPSFSSVHLLHHRYVLYLSAMLLSRITKDEGAESSDEPSVLWNHVPPKAAHASILAKSFSGFTTSIFGDVTLTGFYTVDYDRAALIPFRNKTSVFAAGDRSRMRTAVQKQSHNFVYQGISFFFLRTGQMPVPVTNDYIISYKILTGTDLWT